MSSHGLEPSDIDLLFLKLLLPRSPAVKGKLEQGGVVVIGSTPDELDSFLGSEMNKWGQVIKEANIRAQ